ncbi:MAG: TIGR02391 family protein [Pseudomonadota bacterium]
MRSLVEGEQLPDHFLHDSFINDVRPLFLQGRYDLAVFEAFHRLEVCTREAAELGDELIGTRLASRAFHPDDGPLTDGEAEPGERQALMNLMCGALGSYKNPQSHRHVGLDAPEAREMILMASHLLKIVDSRR